MFKKLAFVAVVVMILAAAFASAASLNVSGGTIQAGEDLSVACDPNGVYVDGWGLEAQDPANGTDWVQSVRIADIDDACKGAEMFVKVVGVGGDPIHAEVAPVLGKQTFTFTRIDPELILGIKIWVEGPGTLVQ